MTQLNIFSDEPNKPVLPVNTEKTVLKKAAKTKPELDQIDLNIEVRPGPCLHCNSGATYNNGKLRKQSSDFLYQIQCTQCSFKTYPCLYKEEAIRRWNSGMKYFLINSWGKNKGKTMTFNEYYQSFPSEIPKPLEPNDED